MNFGTLTKALMKNAVRLAGDGAHPITIRYLSTGSYDPVTGTTTTATADLPVRHALVGKFSEAEVVKHNVNAKCEKVVVARADIQTLPTPDDWVLHAGKTWAIDKVWEDMQQAAVIIAICAP